MMQPLTGWTFVQLAVYVIVWVLIFCIGYLIFAWWARRKAGKRNY